MSAPDGGAAFPSAPPFFGQGMSLRDYFAAQALNRISLDVLDRLAAPEAVAWDEIDDQGRLIVPAAEIARRLAVATYLVADAMLAEHQKGGGA